MEAIHIQDKDLKLREEIKAMGVESELRFILLSQLLEERGKKIDELIALKEDPKSYIASQEQRIMGDIRNGKLTVVHTDTREPVRINKYIVD